MTAPDQLKCLALTDGRQVRAICLLEPRTTHVLGRTRALGRHQRVWGVLWQWHARQANVLCPDDEAQRELVPAVVAHLRRKPEGRQLRILGPTPASSTLWDGLRRLGRGGYHVDLRESVHLLDCSMPFDELRASLSRSFRHNLNKAAHRLAKLHEVHFVTAAKTGDLDAEFATFLEVEASGWKGESGARVAIRCHEPWLAFFRDLAANLRGDADYCEISALYAEGRCLASQFATRTGKTYSVLKIGHDEAYRHVAPGQLLVERLVERCCQDPGIEQFDMVSDAPWLRGWRPNQVRLQVAYVVVGRWPAYPIIAALLQLRFGPGRRFARRLRSLRAAWSRGRERS